MEQKVCKKCNKEKPITDFYKRTYKSGNIGYQFSCKECFNMAIKIVHTTKTYKSKKLANSRRARAANMKRAVDLLGGECQICKLRTTDYEVYDFHHKNPLEKEEMISNLARLSWERMEAEVLKCMLLCCICHRRLHAGRFNDQFTSV